MSQHTTESAQLLQVSCTGVLVQLTLKFTIDPQTVLAHMPVEVRDTVLLNLDGHITQWWALCDRPGVVFLFNSTSVEEVQQLMAPLPLLVEDLVDLTFTRLGPLVPLRLLLNAAAPAQSSSGQS